MHVVQTFKGISILEMCPMLSRKDCLDLYGQSTRTTSLQNLQTVGVCFRIASFLDWFLMISSTNSLLDLIDSFDWKEAMLGNLH